MVRILYCLLVCLLLVSARRLHGRCHHCHAHADARPPH